MADWASGSIDELMKRSRSSPVRARLWSPATPHIVVDKYTLHFFITRLSCDFDPFTQVLPQGYTH